ncbi:hypothetical protein Tco_0888618 [Tanacetum coccineum]
MEAISSPMVAAEKLPVLNPGEFELWKMRIEQYFLMTDYTLWEVIVNGDSPPPKRTVDEQISKKRTKNKAKTTKSDTEWKSVEKTKSRQSPSQKKSTKVNPDKSKVKK